jgi:hypothetical protein
MFGGVLEALLWKRGKYSLSTNEDSVLATMFRNFSCAFVRADVRSSCAPTRVGPRILMTRIQLKVGNTCAFFDTMQEIFMVEQFVYHFC